jgi:hypothetical protein
MKHNFEFKMHVIRRLRIKKMAIGRLWKRDDMARLHVKIEILNNFLMGFYFIKSIDSPLVRVIFLLKFGFQSFNFLATLYGCH